MDQALSILDNLFSNLKNTSSPFTFEASNVNSIFKYLNTVSIFEVNFNTLTRFMKIFF